MKIKKKWTIWIIFIEIFILILEASIVCVSALKYNYNDMGLWLIIVGIPILVISIILAIIVIMKGRKYKKIENEKTRQAKEKSVLKIVGILIFIFILYFGFWEYLIIRALEAEAINCAAKPIIYLYPEEEAEVEVKATYPEKFTCTYPKYQDSWKVLAKPTGNLIDLKTGRSLYALYYEGLDTIKTPKDEGFVVKGEDTISFLEEKLEILGLNEREANEFIIYWLPKLEDNEYNYIRFKTIEEINENMPLEITPTPDTVIRIMMEYKPLTEFIEVQEQKLTTPTREGFTVVEWGGTEIK